MSPEEQVLGRFVEALRSAGIVDRGDLLISNRISELYIAGAFFPSGSYTSPAELVILYTIQGRTKGNKY